jgi:hypothetical protein
MDGWIEKEEKREWETQWETELRAQSGVEWSEIGLNLI